MALLSYVIWFSVPRTWTQIGGVTIKVNGRESHDCHAYRALVSRGSRGVLLVGSKDSPLYVLFPEKKELASPNYPDHLGLFSCIITQNIDVFGVVVGGSKADWDPKLRIEGNSVTFVDHQGHRVEVSGDLR